MPHLWINLQPIELIGLSGFWVALVILAVQLRQSYLLDEESLSERQKRRLRPEADLARRIRLWGSISFLGLILVLVTYINIDTIKKISHVILNLSSFFTLLAILLSLVAYIRYLFSAYLIDLITSLIRVSTLSVKLKRKSK